jgi:hypothetical protein
MGEAFLPLETKSPSQYSIKSWREEAKFCYWVTKATGDWHHAYFYPLIPGPVNHHYGETAPYVFVCLFSIDMTKYM